MVFNVSDRKTEQQISNTEMNNHYWQQLMVLPVTDSIFPLLESIVLEPQGVFFLLLSLDSCMCIPSS